ncbi:MAG: hypothetical protein AAF570_11070 [Bacteroidota bacterium]
MLAEDFGEVGGEGFEESDFLEVQAEANNRTIKRMGRREVAGFMVCFGWIKRFGIRFIVCCQSYAFARIFLAEKTTGRPKWAARTAKSNSVLESKDL